MMCEDNISKLKTMYDNCNYDITKQLAIFNEFLKKFPKEALKELSLDNYTNIKGKGDVEYFTHWIERKTEKCGKFRTSSSFAYGVYKVNANNIKNEDEKGTAKSNPYRTVEVKSEKDVSKKYVSAVDAQEYFNQLVRIRLVQLANFEDIDDTKPLDINYARKVAYMYNPDKLLPVYKKEVIKTIADFLGVQVDCKSYKATEPILEKLKDVFGIKKPITFEVTQKLMRFLWEHFGESVALDSKNIIFYGAPGTGKTFTVQNAVKQRVRIAGDVENDVAVFTQFHPSFGYEDFIEGLKPVITNGSVGLKLTNGIFKKLCKKAMDNLKSARSNSEKPKIYYFVADEINRAELSTVFGELLVCLEENKRVDFDSNGKVTDRSMLVDTQYSYLIDQAEDAVLDVDGKYKFGVPANLYFIGTMNDIDRSIDSFDLALRRRFVWERMDCDYSVIVNDSAFSDVDSGVLSAYVEKCRELNKYISEDLGLGKSYEIGHAYFMEIKVYNDNISDSAKANLFEKKLKPLIEEYLRAEYSQLEIEKKLNDAKKRFLR